MNADEFAKLTTTCHKFEAVDSFSSPHAEQFYGARVRFLTRAEFRHLENWLPTWSQIKDFPAIRALSLKVGCQVILLANIDTDKGLCNGSRGIIVDFKLPSDEPESGKRNGKPPQAGRRSGQSVTQSADLRQEEATSKFMNYQQQKLCPEVFFANGMTSAYRCIYCWYAVESYLFRQN